MPKFKFTCDHSNSFVDEHVITQEFRAESLNDVLENFEMFLRGAGYVVDGVLDIVPHDDEWVGQPGRPEPAMYDETDVLSTKSKHYFDTERNK